MFDAVGLFVYGDDDHWAKLALEVTAAGPTIVSVVTDTFSDDCNSTVLAQSSAWLRLARVGEAIAFHASDGGGRWELVRVFRAPSGAPRIGFICQAPTGAGCTGSFDAIAFTARSLERHSRRQLSKATRRQARTPAVVSPPPPRPVTAARTPSRSDVARRNHPGHHLDREPARLHRRVLAAEPARRLGVAGPERDAAQALVVLVDERAPADEVAAVAQIGAEGEMPILELGRLLVRELRCIGPEHQQHERVPVELHAAN